MHPNGIWEAFPGVPGGTLPQPVFEELRPWPGLRVSLGQSQAQASSSEPICLSGQRNPKHPERPRRPGLAPEACSLPHALWLVVGGNESEAWIYRTARPLQRGQAKRASWASGCGNWRLGAEKCLLRVNL